MCPDFKNAVINYKFLKKNKDHGFTTYYQDAFILIYFFIIGNSKNLNAFLLNASPLAKDDVNVLSIFSPYKVFVISARRLISRSNNNS